MTDWMERSEKTGTGRGHHGRAVAGVLAAATVAGLAVAGVAQASAGDGGSRATAAAAPTCGVSSLRASLDRDLAGGMMHQGAVLHLTNTGSATCDLLGYPGLGLEDAGHKALATKTTWGGTYYAADPGKSVLRLKPGQSAEAVIAWTHANTGTSAGTHAAYLEVTPPASTAHKTLKFDNWVDNGDLSVTSLARTVDIND